MPFNIPGTDVITPSPDPISLGFSLGGRFLTSAFGNRTNEARVIGREQAKAARSVMSKQMGIFQELGATDSNIYKRLATAQGRLNLAADESPEAIFAEQGHILKTIQDAQNIIQPIPSDFTGQLTKQVMGKTIKNKDPLFTRKVLPIAKYGQFLDAIQGEGFRHVTSPIPTLSPQRRRGAALREHKKALANVKHETITLDPDAIRGRLGGGGIEDQIGTTLPLQEVGGFTQTRVPQPGDPDFVGPLQQLEEIPTAKKDTRLSQLLKLLPRPQFQSQQFESPLGFDIDFFDDLAINNILSGGGRGSSFNFGGLTQPQQPQKQLSFGSGMPFSPTGGNLFSARQKAPSGLAFLS